MQLTLKDFLSPAILLAGLVPFFGFLLRLRDQTNALRIEAEDQKRRTEDLSIRQNAMETTLGSLREQMARIEAKLDMVLSDVRQHAAR